MNEDETGDARAECDGAGGDGDGARVCRALAVTLGERGAIYFAAPGFERLSDLKSRRTSPATGGVAWRDSVLRSVPVPPGIGMFRAIRPDAATCGAQPISPGCSRGDKLGDAIDAAMRAAARNVDHRGATGLANYLRGELA